MTSNPDIRSWLIVFIFAVLISMSFRFFVIKIIEQTVNIRKSIIPIFSWINKKAPVKVVNIVFDLIFTVLVIIIYLHSQNLWISGLKIVLIAGLLSLALIDWYMYRLPNIFIITSLIVIISIILVNSDFNMSYIYGALTGMAGGLVIRVFGKMYYKREVFGLGDIKLLLLMGLITGMNYFFPIFLVGMLIASIYSIIAVLTGYLQWMSKIPLGSFLCIAIIIYLIIDPSYLDLLYNII